MKKFLYLVMFVFSFFVVGSINVDAKTTEKQCSYYVNAEQLTGDGGSTIDCTFEWSDSLLFGGFSYSCKYKVNSKEDATILIGNYNKERGTDFNLSSWFKDNKSCPRYLVFDLHNLSSSGSAYAANTNQQVELIRKKYGASFASYLETSIKKNELENDPNSEAAKECEESKKALEDAISLLEGRKKNWEELNCQNYKLSDEERENVASSENIEWGRKCKEILDTYDISVSAAKKSLNDYVNSGCISKKSQEYKDYKNKITNLKQEADSVSNNIEEQNTKPSDAEKEWENLKDGVTAEDFKDPDIECEDIIDTETPGAFGWLLNTILNYIKVIGPVLVVLLSAIDFIKAIFGFDEKAMKEAQNKLIIRLVAALALFLIPTLVQLLLSFINQAPCVL